MHLGEGYVTVYRAKWHTDMIQVTAYRVYTHYTGPVICNVGLLHQRNRSLCEGNTQGSDGGITYRLLKKHSGQSSA